MKTNQATMYKNDGMYYAIWYDNTGKKHTVSDSDEIILEKIVVDSYGITDIIFNDSYYN